MLIATEIKAGERADKLLPAGLAKDAIVGTWVGDGLDRAGLQLPWVERQQLEVMLGRGLHPVTGEPVGEPFSAGQVVGWDLDFVANKEAYSTDGNPGASRADIREAIQGVPGKFVGCQVTEAIAAVESARLGLVAVLLSRPEPWPKGRVHDHVIVWARAWPGEATVLTPEAMSKAVGDIEGAFDTLLYHEAIGEELYAMGVY